MLADDKGLVAVGDLAVVDPRARQRPRETSSEGGNLKGRARSAIGDRRDRRDERREK